VDLSKLPKSNLFTIKEDLMGKVLYLQEAIADKKEFIENKKIGLNVEFKDNDFC
jgi:hypothetical protein